jgi:membrane dipeptidase
VGAQFWSVYIPAEDPEAGYARVQLEQIDLARRIISRYPDRLTLALTADDVKRAFEAGRIASLIGMEGGHAIENSLGALRAYYDLGARYMTLTHNGTLDWADAATDTARHGGLTRFGEEVVREMNRLGMLVDLSHASPDSMRDAIRVSEAPVMFSHSSARALCDVPRNVPDAVLELMPENGGIVMITFVPSFVSQAVADVAMPAWQEVTERSRGVEDPEQQRAIFEEVFSSLELPKVSIAQVADHVDHVRKVAGADHVGIGGDYDGASIWPEGLEDVSRYPHLFAELVRRGWSDGDLRKLAGENMLRVLRKAEETGQRLQTLRQPSIATIESLDGPAHD